MSVRRPLRIVTVLCLISVFLLVVGQALAKGPLTPSQVTTAATSDQPAIQRPIFPSAGSQQALLAPNVLAGHQWLREQEPNNTAANANLLPSSSEVVQGSITPNGDHDVFAIQATAGDRIYAATMTLGDVATSLNSVIEILDTNGTTVIETDDDDGVYGSTASSVAGRLLPSTGTYYIRVRNSSAFSQLIPYQLYVGLQSGTPVAEFEPNNATDATANSLPASGWVNGTISVVGDVDVYTITLSAGDTVYASLDMDPERDNTSNWNGRLGMGLFNGLPMMINDSSTNSPNSEAFFLTVKDAGTYYVLVDASTGAGPSSTYHLSVNVHSSDQVSCTTYVSTDVPKTIGPGAGLVTSVINIPDNVRIRDLNLSLDLSHTNIPDLDVTLMSPAGNNNTLFTDVGSNALTSLNVTLDDEGAVPIGSYTSLISGVHYQTRTSSRLHWFDGENASGTWTLNVYDDAASNGGTLNGWSLTVCATPPPPVCPPNTEPVTVFSTNFEANNGNFTHSGTGDEWEYGLPTFAPITSCNSGTKCWDTDLDGAYARGGSNHNLFSPNVSLTGVVPPIRVSWAQKYQMGIATVDHAWVDVRKFDTTMPRRLWEHLDGNMRDNVGSAGTPIAHSAGWGVREADISEYLGQNIQMYFHVDGTGVTDFAGLAIDDVSITACRPTIGADLSITKVDQPDPVERYQSLFYTLTVANGGPETATNVLVTDTLPFGMDVVTATTLAGSCDVSGNPVICSLGDLMPTSTVQVVIEARPTWENPCGVQRVNQAMVGSNVVDLLPSNNIAQISTTIACPLYCETVRSTDVPKAIPDTSGAPPATSILNIPNNYVIADLNVVGITITHIFDEDLDVYLISPPPINRRVELFTDVGGTGDNFINTTLDDEAATAITSGSAPFTGAFRPEGLLSGYDNLSSMGTWTLEVDDDFAGDPGTLSAWGLELCTNELETDLEITKSASDDAITSGDEITYTLVISNNGPNVATSVVVTDVLPAGFTLSSTTPADSCEATGQTVVCEVPSLAAQETTSITLVALSSVLACVENVTNSATVGSDLVIDTVPGNNSDSASTTVTCVETPTPTATASATVTPTMSATPTATATESATPSATATGSTTPSVTATESATPSATATGSTTPSATATGSTTPSVTATGSTTPSATATGSTTPSVTATGSTTPSATATGSTTPSVTATGSTTPSATATGSTTPTATGSASATATSTLTPTETGTPTPTTTATGTITTCELGDVDLDNNGQTNIIDVQMVAGNFQAAGLDVLGDVDCDGAVDVDDIIMVGEVWQ